MRPQKRLVVCCDGTWKRADDQNVSNIEKIARAIDTTPLPREPVQVVYYTAGVGTGATRTERFLGGGLGLGLDISLIGAYRFLALNYTPGDEVFVFGFSRGAYTARSLVGMIATIGLLKPEGVVQDNLHNAINVYRNRPRKDDPHPDPDAEKDVEHFRKGCYRNDQMKIRFLGVFDTVGALGVPGLSRRKYQFHNVALPDEIEVVTARQALAIDEQRRTFTPAVWSRGEQPHTDVKQVWFEGVHTDIGGGYPESNLSDLTLLWMLREAKTCGLVVHDTRINSRLDPKPVDPPHNSLIGWYPTLNRLSKIGQRLGLSTRIGLRFSGNHRLLESSVKKDSDKDLSIYLAQTAHDRWKDTSAELRERSTIGWWTASLKRQSIKLTDRIEELPPFPASQQSETELRSTTESPLTAANLPAPDGSGSVNSSISTDPDPT
ncbi:MAG: DUF2235 domain-containing protein [Comamonadaceae bacterium]|nr:MAG: DUF2235 domain-containing protein [Comamonadaceae bacterium]